MSRKTEAFIEQRPAEEGCNLRHWRTSPEHFGRHFMRPDCPCGPERIPHTSNHPTGDNP